MDGDKMENKNFLKFDEKGEDDLEEEVKDLLVDDNKISEMKSEKEIDEIKGEKEEIKGGEEEEVVSLKIIENDIESF